jgi:hypothetical protein
MPGFVHQKGFNDADLVDFLRSIRNRITQYSVLPNLAVGSVNAFNLKTLATVTAFVDGLPVSNTLLADQAITAAFAATVVGAAQGIAGRVEYNAALTALTLKIGALVPAGASDRILKYLPMPYRTAGVPTCGFLLIQGAFTFGTTSLAGFVNDGDPDQTAGFNLAGLGTCGLVS